MGWCPGWAGRDRKADCLGSVRRLVRSSLLIAAAAVVPADALPEGQGAQPAAVQFTLCASGPRINCVVDGDTFWFRGEKIRVADINTPETFRPECAYEKDLGTRAKVRFLALLNTGPFELIRAGGKDKDFFGRKLRVIMREGQSLGAVLVAEGLARPWAGRRRPWCT